MARLRLAAIEQNLNHLRPAGRALVLAEFDWLSRPAMLTEFGGTAFSGGDGWGYSRATDAEGYTEHYSALLEAVHGCKALAGFCYTQLTDTFQEKNGLLCADPTPKADIARLSSATRSAQYGETNPLGYSRRWLERQKIRSEEPKQPL